MLKLINYAIFSIWFQKEVWNAYEISLPGAGIEFSEIFWGRKQKEKIVIRKWIKLIIIKKAFKLRLLISIWSFDYKLKL